jgi:hypothetical protein
MSQLKPPTSRLAALLAALLVVVLAVAGCGHSATPRPAAPSSTLAAAKPARPQPGRVRLGDGATHVAVAATDLTAHAKPADGGRVLGRFVRATAWGSPTPFLVTRAYRDAAGGLWLRVLLPRRPNGSAGWIRGDQVRLRPVAYALEVDLSSRTVRLLRNGRGQGSWPVGIGRAVTPTPDRAVLRYRQASAAAGFRRLWRLGAGAVGLLGGAGAVRRRRRPDRPARHQRPQRPRNRVSNGCVRLDDQAITTLAKTLPLGTPVTIQA